MSSGYKKIDNFYYDPERPIGKGSFGNVFKAIDQRNDRPVAVKVVPCKLIKDRRLDEPFLREINILNEIKSEYFVQLIDLKRTNNNVYIFMDYCDGGDLETKLRQNYCFSEQEACSIIKQIAYAFVFIQHAFRKDIKTGQLNLMHRDIKPSNILFHQGRIKIVDFGFAQFINEDEKSMKKAYALMGTPLHMSPQILNKEAYSDKCDIWSTGILFYKLLFHKLPWNGNSISDLYKNILSDQLSFPMLSFNVSKQTKELISHMLQIEEEDRFSWEQVLNHPALSKVNVEIPGNIPSPILSSYQIKRNKLEAKSGLKQKNWYDKRKGQPKAKFTKFFSCMCVKSFE